jgi:oligopeptide transport system permease protein
MSELVQKPEENHGPDLNDKDLFTFQQADEFASEHIAAPKYSYWGSVFRQFFSSKIAIAMLCLTVFIVLMAFIQPLFSHYDPMDNSNILDKSQWFIRPCWKYPFGTDDYGRSLFDAVWAGTRTSLTIAFIGTAIDTVVGLTVGLIWGYSQKVDAVMIEVYNVLSNIPQTLVIMILAYTMGSGMKELIFAMTVTSWIGTAYFIRVQVMIIRDREYNLASRCLGTPATKILINNILPYLVSVLMTTISREIPSFISYEVWLSYVGVGLNETYASLGRTIRRNAQYMNSAPYLFWIPVTASAAISVSLYIVGQKLADASDPRTHMR